MCIHARIGKAEIIRQDTAGIFYKFKASLRPVCLASFILQPYRTETYW
jgi:hypothetical protein